ncbi:sensor histidine kinase [Arthrobacter woluwensis]|uniref:histidine kinase n=1 Tax=Arthrobacter woluwensis TaxID=156980 RepID=A0A1H4R2I4_9MICC|nr:histidine kinase [Arthrobacter woluwensis]SEC25921.1 Signal transduction histidine kinase [Arthrobacter woluwensis]
MNTDEPRGWSAPLLNVIGSAVVGDALFRGDDGGRPLWAAILAGLSLTAWAVRGLSGLVWRDRRADVPLGLVAALTGAASAGPTDGLTVVPAAIGILIVISTPAVPLVRGVAAALVSCALVAVSGVPVHASVPAVVTMMGGLILAAVGGFSRRQFREAEAQAALLRERELAMRQDAERVAIARDLHDVLAHSLGGLVLQLDAAEALLETGDHSAAAERVAAARRLASDGLSEARRAVATLRDPQAAAVIQAAALDAVTPGVEQLLQAHRSLGGVVDFTETGTAHPLSDRTADALLRAVQEALSNARKHAPGEPVRAGLTWKEDTVTLTVSNPLPDTESPAGDSPGRGYGLTGMRERFEALGPRSSVRAGVQGDRFVVTAEAAL